MTMVSAVTLIDILGNSSGVKGSNSNSLRIWVLRGWVGDSLSLRARAGNSSNIISEEERRVLYRGALVRVFIQIRNRSMHPGSRGGPARTGLPWPLVLVVQKEAYIKAGEEGR